MNNALAAVKAYARSHNICYTLYRFRKKDYRLGSYESDEGERGCESRRGIYLIETEDKLHLLTNGGDVEGNPLFLRLPDGRKVVDLDDSTPLALLASSRQNGLKKLARFIRRRVSDMYGTG